MSNRTKEVGKGVSCAGAIMLLGGVVCGICSKGMYYIVAPNTILCNDVTLSKSDENKELNAVKKNTCTTKDLCDKCITEKYHRKKFTQSLIYIGLGVGLAVGAATVLSPAKK